MENPHDLKLSPDGKYLFVSDRHKNRVTIYDMEGLKAKMVGALTDCIRGPEGVLAHPNGRIYVAGAWSGNVVVYEAGKVVVELKGLSSPHNLEPAPNGDFWLADAGNDRMILLSPDLEIIRELKGAPYNFNGVRYQDVLSDGILITADKNNHQVKVIGPKGDLILLLATGRPEMGPGQFKTPEGIEVKGDTLWISDPGNDRVVEYRITKQ